MSCNRKVNPISQLCAKIQYTKDSDLNFQNLRLVRQRLALTFFNTLFSIIEFAAINPCCKKRRLERCTWVLVFLEKGEFNPGRVLDKDLFAPKGIPIHWSLGQKQKRTNCALLQLEVHDLLL